MRRILFIPVSWQLRADRVRHSECLKELGDHRTLVQPLRHFSAPVHTTGKSTSSFLGKKVTKKGFSLTFNCCLVPSEGRQVNESEAC